MGSQRAGRETKNSTSIAESRLHPREEGVDKRAQKRGQDLWVTVPDLLKRLPPSGHQLHQVLNQFELMAAETPFLFCKSRGRTCSYKVRTLTE